METEHLLQSKLENTGGDELTSPLPESGPASDESGEQGEGQETSTPHPMAGLSEESLELKRFQRGQLVKGVVVARTEKEVLVDIGGKSEGVVPADDLRLLDPDFVAQLSEGQEVTAYVLNPETPDGHVLLSLSRAQVEAQWNEVQAWQAEGRIVEAPVEDVNRGGLVVRLGLLRGFVPASHVVPRPGMRQNRPPVERFAPLRGQTLKLKIIEVDRSRRRLVLSEREAQEEITRQAREQLLAELEPGQVRRGRVKSLTRFGAFVDLGGVDGLIHISELSWGRVQHPSEVVQVGDEVEVYVLHVDREEGRVGLSLRRLQPEPWETVLDRYAIGQVVEGVVTKVMPYGVFVRLEDGIEGLVHISELADRYVAHPHEVVKEGEKVQVRILSIDPESRRMSLSIKQASEDAYVEIDWEEAEPDEVTLGDVLGLGPAGAEPEATPVDEYGDEDDEDEGEPPSA